MSKETRIRTALQRHPTYTDNQIARCVGHTSVDEVRSLRDVTPPLNVKRRTLEDFNKLHNKSLRLETVVEEIVKEYLTDGGWLYESEVISLVMLKVANIRNVWPSIREKYARYVITINGKRIWRDTEIAEKIDRIANGY